MSTVITTTTTSELEVLKRGRSKNVQPTNSGTVFVEESLKENEAMMEVPADKKTDQETPTAPSGGYLWRFSSGVYSMTTGAVSGAASAGINSAKWVAGTGMSVGSAIYSKVPSIRRQKDKNE